jgi:histidinol dehydrogenase
MAVPDARRYAQSLDAGRLAHLAGVTRVFTIGGAQGIRSARVRNGNRPRRSTRSAVRATPTWRRPSVASSVPVGIDMVAGVSEIVVVADGNPPTPTGLRLDLFSQASTTKCAGDPDHARRRPHRLVSEASARRLSRGNASRIESSRRRSAGEARSFLARSRRGLHARESHCAGAPRALRWRIPTRWLPMIRHGRRHFPRPTMRTEALGRLLRGSQSRCCPPDAPRAFPRRLASTTSRSARACCGFPRGAAQVLGPVAATLGARARASTRHARSAEARPRLSLEG